MFCGAFHQKDLNFHTLMVFFGENLLWSCSFHQNIFPKLASTRKVRLGKVRLALLWFIYLGPVVWFRFQEKKMTALKPEGSFIENCEDLASWPKHQPSFNSSVRFSNHKRSREVRFGVWISTDVADRTFSNSNCYLQHKLSSGEVMQRKWFVYSAGKKLDILLLL